MGKSVVELQNAFQRITNKLMRNKNVLAIFTFGSIISGDVWEESDIDLFVIYDGDFKKLRDIYSESLSIPVHTKVLQKESFLDMVENNENSDLVENILINSKMVYCKDKQISELYNNFRYSNSIDTKKNNLVYLGKLLKDLGVCRKYLNNGIISTTYEVLIRLLDSYSKLYLSINGYTVTKDAINMASNLNKQFNHIINTLIFDRVDMNKIKSTIDFIYEFLDENIIIITSELFEFIRNSEERVSAFDILNSDEFKNYDIKIEFILKELEKRKLIIKARRIITDRYETKLLYENVYYVKE